jgi:hypothetical protein
MSIAVLDFILCSTYIVSTVADAYTTSVVLGVGGKEANPLQAWLQKKLGIALGTFVLGMTTLVSMAAVGTYSLTNLAYMAGALTAAHGGAAIWNVIQYNKSKK